MTRKYDPRLLKEGIFIYLIRLCYLQLQDFSKYSKSFLLHLLVLP